jgi:hypothetical protein
MNPYISISMRIFTIWIMAAVINGLLCGIYLGIPERSIDSACGWVFLSGLLSLFFSIPGFFIFWIVMFAAINRRLYDRALFRAALATGIILSAISAFSLNTMFARSDRLPISFFIIISATASIMMHFNCFKEITNGGNKEKIKSKIYT